jgi:hypothetical protein
LTHDLRVEPSLAVDDRLATVRANEARRLAQNQLAADKSVVARLTKNAKTNVAGE